ncbi:integrase, catalytic region, zinc finger, CCHC-type containing protein [Tanacetum coccineum]
MMLLARAITQCYSTPTNNRLCTSSNTRNQAVIQDGSIDIQSKNVSYAGNGKENVQCYKCNAKGHYSRNCPKLKVRDGKYFRKQMLQAMKDKDGGNLNDEENNFMLDVRSCSYLHGYGVCRQHGYAVLGIGQTRFLVKSWRRYAVSL